MSQVLQLESFRRTDLADPPEPVFSATELAQARAEGEAAGRAFAEDAAMGALTAALHELGKVMGAEEARRAELRAQWEGELAVLARAIVVTLAGPLRGEALAGRVVEALLAEAAAGEALPTVVRCASHAAPTLRAGLAEAGLTGVSVEPADGSEAEFVLGDGIIRICPQRIETLLDEIIAEIGAQDKDASK